MREVILWGGTGQARVLNECLFGTDHKIVAVFDNASLASPLPDVPLHVGVDGFRSWMQGRQSIWDLYFLVAVGGTTWLLTPYSGRAVRSLLTRPCAPRPASSEASS
jgi:hypothetical protein